MGYYTARAQELLGAARPLMDIYRIDNQNEFSAFLQADSEAVGNAQEHPLVACRSTPSTRLLLVEMLEQGLGSKKRRRAGIDAAACSGTSARSCIFSRPARSMSRYRCLTREEFEAYPPNPRPFELAFCEQSVAYTYEQYLAHMESTPTASQRSIRAIK